MRHDITSLAEIPPMHAAARGGATAIKCEDRILTYGELDRRAGAAAGMLAAMSVDPGDRVAWLGRSHEAFFELLFASAKVRACFTPINTRLAVPEIAFILDDSSADVLFVTADFLGAARAALEAIPRWIELVVVDARHAPYGDYQAMRDAARPYPARTPLPADDVIQMYTSGTTGLPKGVRHTNASVCAYLNAAMTIEGLAQGPEDTLIGVMPLFHVGGLNPAFATLAGGARLVLMAVFEPAAYARMIEAERATIVVLVPSMLGMVLRWPDTATIDVSSVRVIAYGGSPISEAVLTAAFARFDCGVIQMFGMTETNAAGTILSVQDHREGRLRSCGRPFPGHEVRVVDGAGAPVATGKIGEIQIRGPALMTGYWNRPQETAETITPDGWLNTGDAGYGDADGYFYVHDRVKDMIVSGGENVYPAEVENAIMGCPGVAEAAVIGVPDARWGEAVKAVVIRAPGADVGEAAVIAWVRTRIAGYKTPKTVEFIDVLPRNGTNKVLRRVLREPYWAGRGRLVG